jgi:predicted dehydrogenase
MIGTGNQGINDMRSFLRDPRVQVVAVCDVNRKSDGYWDGAMGGREVAREIVEQHYADSKPSGSFLGCREYEDYRELLAQPDIDAVEIATPDHWHAIQVIDAAKAGKDIYCQKPLTLTVTEGRAMSNAVARFDRVFQTGSQQRSDPRFRKACEIVLNGGVGKVRTVQCGLPGGWPDFSKKGHLKQPSPVPEGFNYDMWLGPAPDAPYSPARCHVNYRWIFDYSGGQVTDWGGHHPDIAQWGLGMERSGPIAIQNAKGAVEESPLYNTFTEYYFECVYANGAKVIVSNQFENGVRFEGTDGWVFVSRGRIEASPESLLKEEFGRDDKRLRSSTHHFRNFIDCVISRAETVAPCEVAHRSVTLSHLGNIAMLLARDLKWNPKTENVLDDPSAQWMLNRPYRAPWALEWV